MAVRQSGVAVCQTKIVDLQNNALQRGLAVLNICISYPPNFDAERFRLVLGDLGRDAVVAVVPYEDPTSTRLMKSSHGSREEIKSSEGAMSREYLQALADAEALLAFDLPMDVVDLAPKLRFVQAIGSGIDHFDLVALTGANIIVANAKGLGAVGIAEFVFARLLDVWKRSRDLEEMQAARKWDYCTGRLLSGCTIGIVGLGAIGSATAHLAKSFGMRVLATRKSWIPGMPPGPADEVFGPEAIYDVIARCHAVVLAAPADDTTNDLVDTRFLSSIKAGAVLCNVARGALVDEEAVLLALREGRLGAAILDVTKEEPLPAESPLWSAPNLFLSPHSANSMDGYFDRLGDLFADNITRLTCDQEVRNRVEPAAARSSDPRTLND